MHRTSSLPAEELQERAAEPAQDARVNASTARLQELRDERNRLLAQHAALPLRDLRELDAIINEQSQVQTQRETAATRLAEVPAPQRRGLGRTHDRHATERERLSAEVSAADQQIDALEQQAGRLQRHVGPAGAARQERDGLQGRLADVEHQARVVCDELADRQVAQPPAWARDMFGERPQASYRQAEHYDRGIREVARYRIAYDIPDHTPGLGAEPEAGDQRTAWRQADRAAEQAQRRLGRDVTRDRERDIGLER